MRSRSRALTVHSAHSYLRVRRASSSCICVEILVERCGGEPRRPEQCPLHRFFSPDFQLSPTKFRELGCPQRCFCDRKELVELWWHDGRAAEHGVSLTP